MAIMNNSCQTRIATQLFAGFQSTDIILIIFDPSKSRVKVDKEIYKRIEEFCKKIYNTDGNVYVNPRIDKFGRCK